MGKLLCQSTQPIWQVCIPNRFELGRCLSFLRARHPLGELGLLRRGRRLDRPVRGHFRWAFELLRDDRFRFYRLFFWQLQRPGGKGRDGFIVQRLQPLWKLRFLGRLDSRLGLRLFLGQVQGPGGKGGDGFTVQIPQPLWHALPLAFLDLGRFLQAGQPIGDLGLLARQLLIKQGKLFARLLTLQPLFGQLQRPGGKAGDGLTVQLPQPIRKLRFLGLLDSRLGLRLFLGQVQGPGGKGGDGFTVQIPQPLWHALPLAFLDLGRFLQAGQPIGDLGLLARQLLIKQGKLFARLLTLQPLFGQLQRPGGKAGDGLTVQLPQPIRKLRFLGLLDSRLGLRLFPG